MSRAFSRMNCELVRGNWAVQPKDGQPDMDSHWCVPYFGLTTFDLFFWFDWLI